MSFQAYLDAIEAKTGKTPSELVALAAARGFTGDGLKAADVIAWLKDDFDLGRGHAMAIFALLKTEGGPRAGADDRLAKLFAGGRAAQRPTFEAVLQLARSFEADVGLAPTDTYVSLLRGKKKFAIVQPAAGHLDVGIKLKGADPTARFADAGSWNSMVTHRVRLSSSADADSELARWLRDAYDAAG